MPKPTLCKVKTPDITAIPATIGGLHRAVAVGFEPTVGLTPHIISSDAPSAARTRHRGRGYRNAGRWPNPPRTAGQAPMWARITAPIVAISARTRSRGSSSGISGQLARTAYATAAAGAGDDADVAAHRADRAGLVDEGDAAIGLGVRQRVEAERRRHHRQVGVGGDPAEHARADVRRDDVAAVQARHQVGQLIGAAGRQGPRIAGPAIVANPVEQRRAHETQGPTTWRRRRRCRCGGRERWWRGCR